MDEEGYSIRHRLHSATGNLNYVLDCFGDELAKRRGYKDLDGIEAIWFYLIEIHHWLPSQVKAMHPDDIRFLLSQEMHHWTLPKTAISATKKSKTTRD
jgi:hypothetical protein